MTGLLVIIMLASGGSAAQDSGPYEYITSFGTSGSEWPGTGQPDTPLGVAVDRTGTVYVADTCNNRIQAFKKTNTAADSSESAVPSPPLPGSAISFIPGMSIAAGAVGVVTLIRRK